ncbi:MAG TPA: hypothetical protein DCM05_07380 [Elusimicrobia bacterium]|nr:hypothetical protein [Elusimicrobiota bacterium]
MRILLLLAALALAAPCRAQVDVGASAGPDLFLGGGSLPERSTYTPLALALSLCFDSTTWALIGVSTASPAAELSRFAQRGYYKLELLLLIRLAERSGKPLAYLAARREKGEALRALAESLGADYDSLEERALEDDRLAVLRLDGLVRVSPFESPPHPGGRP